MGTKQINKFEVSRDWTELQQLGSGTLRIVEEPEFGRWALELDGMRRTYRSTREAAQAAARLVYDGLVPEGACTACGKVVRTDGYGAVVPHDRPKTWSGPAVACSGGSGARP